VVDGAAKGVECRWAEHFCRRWESHFRRRFAARPDIRFGQLIANLAFMAAGPYDQTLWNLDNQPTKWVGQKDEKHE